MRIRELKNNLIQLFQRSLASQMLTAMLNGKLPRCFMSSELAEKVRKGDELTDAENYLLQSKIQENFRWVMDFLTDVLVKEREGRR